MSYRDNQGGYRVGQTNMAGSYRGGQGGSRRGGDFDMASGYRGASSRGGGGGGGRREGGAQGAGGQSSSDNSGGSGAQKDVRREKTRLVDEITEEFRDMDIQIGDATMIPPQEPGKEGKKIVLTTNIYGLTMRQLPLYRYDITIGAIPTNPRAKPIEFTKRSKDDAVIMDSKNMCRHAYLAMLAKYPQHFGDDSKQFYYDLQSILYSLKKLSIVDELALELDRNECSAIREFQRFDHIEILVKCVNQDLTIGDFSDLNSDAAKQNHSLQQFIELATSQAALFDPSEHFSVGGGSIFLLNPSKYGFTREDGPDIGQSKYMQIGAHKNARYVEGPKGRGETKMGLVVNCKKAPFYRTNISIMELAMNLFERQTNFRNDNYQGRLITQMNTYFKGLHVKVDYGINGGPIRTVQINSISKNTAATHTFWINNPKDPQRETQSTVQSYYENRYKIRLRYPSAPLVGAKERSKINFYPMELCYIEDPQRAQIGQLSEREKSEMISACAVLPNVLKRQVDLTAKSLKLIPLNPQTPNPNPYLEACGLQVRNPLSVNARVLSPPQIIYEDKTINPQDDTLKWVNQNRFLLAGRIQKWGLYLLDDARSRHQFSLNDLRQFHEIFRQECIFRGIQMPNADQIANVPTTKEDLRNQMVTAKGKNYDFVFFVTNESITFLHNAMKGYEQEMELITQDLKSKTAFEIITRNKTETLRNIVAKTNEKLGGMNYSLNVRNQEIREMIKEGTLFIGLGTSHSGAVKIHEKKDLRKNPPSVIGYSANIREDPFDFIGDFVFDRPRRDEKFVTVQAIISNCCERYIKARKVKPKRIIIFRNGTSEGQFSMSLQYEVPLIRHSLQKDLGLDECKLTILVLQRTHNVRLFPEPLVSNANPKANKNIKPGTVVDTQMTHPLHNQFYLTSHLAIKGTANVPRYTVLVDDSQFSLDVIEGFTYALSYCHQIINSPTSLPSPVYIALLYAKRGRAIINEINFDELPTAEHTYGQDYDYSKITEELCLLNKELLCDKRVNA